MPLSGYLDDGTQTNITKLGGFRLAEYGLTVGRLFSILKLSFCGYTEEWKKEIQQLLEQKNYWNESTPHVRVRLLWVTYYTDIHHIVGYYTSISKFISVVHPDKLLRELWRECWCVGERFPQQTIMYLVWQNKPAVLDPI